METAALKRKSRRKMRKGQTGKGRGTSHFRTVCFGGFEETQIICYLWNVIKSMEEGRNAGSGNLATLEKQMRRQMRVEMRRYFARRKRRNLKLIAGALVIVLCSICLFGFVIGVDRVSGNSMYPYLNHGDWIVYGRGMGGIQRDEVVVFDKNGESLVKRVAGLPGDTVEISPSGGEVVVNGVQIRENYVTLTDPVQDEKEQERGAPLTVMEGQYLVLGDNRSVSIDSRDSSMGTVAAEQILGTVILIVRMGQGE